MPLNRKREREPAEDRSVKRAREDKEIIYLSSEDRDSSASPEKDNGSDLDVLENTLVEGDVLPWEETGVVPEASGSTSPKGKGKEVAKPSMDLQEDLECVICCTPIFEEANIATLMVVPHICVPCGHGGCGPCIFKWVEKSVTCPQCRFKLPHKNSAVRDYILERIVDKYAKSTLSPEEFAAREEQITYAVFGEAK